ncbi:MAG: sugar phosphate isomerase/epimerase family protein [Candidatus Hydrogenedentales bacterium]|jgi:sugar phosphate isomerase/epimerase
MTSKIERRRFLQVSGLSTGFAAMGAALSPATLSAAVASASEQSALKLGMVTYNMGKDMSVDELIALCQATGLEGVELRTTHAHGVEVSLSSAQRLEVRKKFEDADIVIAGLGSAFEYHAKDADEVEKNVRDSIAYAKLAADVGSPGIKVRPNGIPKGEDPEITLERIGKAWGRVAAAAADVGVEVRMEVHGPEQTRDLANIEKMLGYANHANARVCWNSNSSDMDNTGSIRANFERVKDAISEVHITDIGVYQYPWQELFTLLQEIGYTGFCLAEISENPEPVRFMRYYKTLFDLYTGAYRYPNEEAYKLG